MGITPEQALDEAARCLRNAYAAFTTTDEDRARKELTLHEADSWLRLAEQFAGLPDDDDLTLVDGGQVEAYEAALQLARDLADQSESVAPGRIAEFRSRARGVVGLYDGDTGGAAEALEALEERIGAAMNLIRDYGRTQGDHHREWLIRQIAIALTDQDSGLPQGIAP